MQYPGGKWKSFQHIINLIPPHEVYIEAFLGSGAVICNKRCAQRNIGIEINPDVIEKNKNQFTNIEIFQTDSINFLSKYQYSGSEVVYCDPPYHPSSRHRQKVYKHDFSHEDHIRFLETIIKLPCKVLVSGYDNEYYDSYLNTWSRYEFYAKTHTERVKEIIWFNYEFPTKLHDARYIGNDFRERQDIKRKLSRLKNKISNLSPIEKFEIFDWLSREVEST